MSFNWSRRKTITMGVRRSRGSSIVRIGVTFAIRDSTATMPSTMPVKDEHAEPVTAIIAPTMIDSNHPGWNARAVTFASTDSSVYVTIRHLKTVPKKNVVCHVASNTKWIARNPTVASTMTVTLAD